MRQELPDSSANELRKIQLTEREAQVLRCAASGMTDKQIAHKLEISQETVGTYWRRILLRYNASSRTEVVARAIETEAKEKLQAAESENEALQAEIAERTAAQARELAHRNLLEAITEASLDFISKSADTRSIFEGLLDHLLGQTMSEYGFIGEVLYEDGVPYLKSHAITNIAWNEETRRLYEENVARGMEFRNLNTLFGEVLRTGQPVIANAASIDKRAGGVPIGHPPLDSFLGMPLYAGESFIGMIGIANRPPGYDEGIVAFLEPFLATCANLIVGYRAENARKSAEEKYAESSRRLEVLMDRINSGVIFEDENRKILFVNEALCRMFHVPMKPTEMTGADCAQMAQGAAQMMAEPNEFLKRVDQLLKAGEPVVGEVVELADGRKVVRDFSPIEVDHAMKGYLWYYREV